MEEEELGPRASRSCAGDCAGLSVPSVVHTMGHVLGQHECARWPSTLVRSMDATWSLGAHLGMLTGCDSLDN